MARETFSVTLGGQLGDGSYRPTSLITTSMTTTNAAVESAVATLEADGASPTQAHVTALRSVWNTLKAGDVQGDFCLNYDNTVITSRNALAAAVKQFLATSASSGALTG